MAAPTLLYGRKTKVPIRKLINKIESAEINFLRCIKGCIVLDRMKKLGEN